MKLAPRDFVVNDSFSEELAELKEEMDKTTGEIEEEYAEAQELWSSETGAKLSDVRLEQDKNGAYYFRIPDTNAEKKLRNIDSFRVCSILKNGVHFETKLLKRLSDGYASNLRDYKKAQASVVSNAMEILETYLDVIGEACTAIGELDSLQSMAQAATMSGAGYIRPTLTDLEEGGKIEIEVRNTTSFCLNIDATIHTRFTRRIPRRRTADTPASSSPPTTTSRTTTT